MNLDIVEADLAKRFPNKRKEHRSKDCLSLLLELKANLPEFTFHQLNHKHINMWTRSIVPFRLLYDSGILFKGKSIFHKDCKRFVKCIFTFLNYTRTRGLMEPLTKVFARLPGQGNKLLEQWLCVMFEIHDIKFAWFLYGCACKMAQSFINSKLPRFITEKEIELLNDEKPKLELLSLPRFEI
ncbi:hypothetical protein GGF37_003459 [Kickxella alabastrina]|nr:hypothetical protein GGF37_003459 [Kickxella alabastrina]